METLLQAPQPKACLSCPTLSLRRWGREMSPEQAGRPLKFKWGEIIALPTVNGVG